MARDLLVVVADDRHVPGDREPPLLQALVAADGHAVVLAEDRARRALQVQQPRGAAVARARRPVAVDDERRVERQVGRGQRAPVAVEPVAGRAHEALADDGADALVAGVDQRARGALPARDLARLDRGQAQVLGAAVEQHHRDGHRGEGLRHRDLAREHARVDEPLDAVVDERGEGPGLELGVVAGLGDDEQRAARTQRLADAPRSRRCPRGSWGQGVDDEGDAAQRRRLQRPERAQLGLVVAEPARGLDDARAGLLADADRAVVVQHERDGGLRAAALARHVAHRHPASGRRRPAPACPGVRARSEARPGGRAASCSASHPSSSAPVGRVIAPITVPDLH